MSRLASRLPAWPFVFLVLAIALLSLLAPSNWRPRRGEAVDIPPPNSRDVKYGLAGRLRFPDEELAGDRRASDARSIVDPSASTVPVIENPPPAANDTYFVSTEPLPGRPEETAPSASTSDDRTTQDRTTQDRTVQEGAGSQHDSVPENSSPAASESGRSALRAADVDSAMTFPNGADTFSEFVPQALPSTPPDDRSNDRPQAGPRGLTPEEEMAGEDVLAGEAPVAKRSKVEETPVSNSVWPQPKSLLDSLQGLISAGIMPEWAHAVLAEVRQLDGLTRFDDPAAKEILNRVKDLSDMASEVSQRLPTAAERGQMMRCAYGISRRLAVWNALHELATRGQIAEEWSLTVSRELELTQQAAAGYLARVQHSQAWRQYVCLDKARGLLGGMSAPTAPQRDLARLILTRLDTSYLNDSQAEFLKHPIFQNWAVALRKYAREGIEPTELLIMVERYEQTLSAKDAKGVAHGFQVLRWSTNEAEMRLAQPLNDHYRNANVRVAISASLINRVLPDEHATVENVDDVIHSARVSGHSQTSSRLRVFLVPDRWQWRLGLEAKGDVAAQTESRKGPATFFQDAWSNFNARKHVTVDKRGVRTERAEARARSSSDLRGFETDYDDIPVFNRLARSIANRQYQEQSQAATAEVEEKVASIASQRLDEEVHKRLSDAEGEFQKRWLSPLRRIGLDPTPIDFETTEQRLIVRYRIAGMHQLAAHTPRPQAPANSWLSIQLHESVLNNTFDQLGLGGRKIAIEDLYRELAAKFDRPVPMFPDDLPEGVTITLAPQEGIRVRCDNGHLTLTLRIAELAQGKSSRWKNFEVRATYVPTTDQRDANLVRDGIIELGGERRGLGNQVALRGIFAKVLSKNRPLKLINHSLAKQPQLADLEVNQFVINDGWMGIAMAPKPNTARIPYRQPTRRLR